MFQRRSGPIHLPSQTDSSLPTTAEKGELPSPATTSSSEHKDHAHSRSTRKAMKLVLFGVLALLAGTQLISLTTRGPFFPLPKPGGGHGSGSEKQHQAHAPMIKYGLAQCKDISLLPPDTTHFRVNRTTSDRNDTPHKPTLLKNGTLWTGGKNGEEVIKGGSVLLKDGVQFAVGRGEEVEEVMRGLGLSLKGGDVEVVDVGGKWITPGIVDIHSHAMIDAAPTLISGRDTNSVKGPAQPWLASLNGFNIHGLELPLIRSGGLTTMLILPGSAGNIGGQAFPIKPRVTKDDSPSSMVVEAPFVVQTGEEGEGGWGIRGRGIGGI